MKRKFSYAIFYLLVFILLGVAVMFLWNYFLPPIIHITTITYWQALGLMLLSRILFGRFRFGSRMDWRLGGWSGFEKDKLINMDESDKARFKEEWRKRCEGRERNET